MITNLDRYKDDLDKLIARGNNLDLAMRFACSPKTITKQLEDRFGDEAKQVIDGIPNFHKEYQRWYSEAQVFG